MAFYSLSEAEQHIMDYMWAHADQETALCLSLYGQNNILK